MRFKTKQIVSPQNYLLNHPVDISLTNSAKPFEVILKRIILRAISGTLFVTICGAI
jgi:hypothetical protein